MLISHKYKFVTIDIPKTGTRSLRETLLPIGIIDIIGSSDRSGRFYQHGSAESCSIALLDINKNFIDYYSFCVVRNPWDRYLSFFKYYKEIYETGAATSVPQKNQLEYSKSLFQNTTEKEILKKIIQTHNAQHSYFMTTDQKILVNKVAQFQNLEMEFNSLCNKCGVLPIPKLKHKNKTTQKINYKDIYDQELIDMVAEKERIVIDKYNFNY